MSDTKFTQGPWAYAIRNNHEIQCSFVGVFIDGEYIDVGFANEEKGRAKAHLIAAAPDMYEALSESNKHLAGEFGVNHPLVKANSAALAKAEGKS